MRPLDGGESFSIEFDDPAYRVGLTGNAEYEARSLRYSYSSLTTRHRSWSSTSTRARPSD